MCVAEQGGQDLLVSPWLALSLPAPRGFSSPGSRVQVSASLLGVSAVPSSLERPHSSSALPHPPGPAEPCAGQGCWECSS